MIVNPDSFRIQTEERFGVIIYTVYLGDLPLVSYEDDNPEIAPLSIVLNCANSDIAKWIEWVNEDQLRSTISGLRAHIRSDRLDKRSLENNIGYALSQRSTTEMLAETVDTRLFEWEWNNKSPQRPEAHLFPRYTLGQKIIAADPNEWLPDWLGNDYATFLKSRLPFWQAALLWAITVASVYIGGSIMVIAFIYWIITNHQAFIRLLTLILAAPFNGNGLIGLAVYGFVGTVIVLFIHFWKTMPRRKKKKNEEE